MTDQPSPPQDSPPSPPPTTPAPGPTPIAPGLLDLKNKIPLSEPRIWTRGFLFLIGALSLGLLLLMRESAEIMDVEFPLIYWSFPILLVTVLAILRRLILPRNRREILFLDEEVQLPRGPNSRRTSTLRYDQIRTIVPLVSRGQPALVIDGPDRTQVYVASDFPHPELWRVLAAGLMDRIGELPDAITQLRSMQALSRLSQITSSLEPTFTKRLFLLLALIFAAQLFLSPPVEVLHYLYFGANMPIMVFGENQWWRVVTANLLHGNTLHFVVNGFALYFLGSFGERLFGRAQAMVLVFATAIAGALASLFFAGALASVGISTALYGLLGAYLAIHLRFGKEIPPPYRQTTRWWVVILGLNAGLTIAVPAIDTFGHFGGLGAGLLLGLLLTRGQKHYTPHPPSGWITNLSAALLTALFAFCVFIAISYAVGEHPEDETALALAILERADEENPYVLARNAHQWSLHSPRPEAVDPILREIARKSAALSNDPQVVRLASQTLLNLPGADDLQTSTEAVLLMEEAIFNYPEESALRDFSTLLYHHLQEHPPIITDPRASRTLLPADDGGLILEPEENRDPFMTLIYLLRIHEETDTFHLIFNCFHAFDPARPIPIAPQLVEGFQVELAMITDFEPDPSNICGQKLQEESQTQPSPRWISFPPLPLPRSLEAAP